MRNPNHPNWPEEGERTSLRAIADRWKWKYASLASGEHRNRALGLPGKQKPLAEIIPMYLDRRRETVERSTWGADRTALGYLLATFPDATPLQITTDKLQKWVHQMLVRGYRPNTLRTYVLSMSAFFRIIGKHNPASGIALPEPGRQDVRWWTGEEMQRIRKAAGTLDEQVVGNFASCRLAIEIGLSMGLRQAEIFGLRWEDIREKERVARVDRQTVKDQKDTKPLKGKLSRTALILPGWWGLHERRFGWILAGPTGEQTGTRSQRNMIQRVLDTAGLNGMGVGWHSLRHTYAAHFLLSGGSLFGLQKSLGHASIKVTEQAYSHLQADAVAEIERKAIYGV